MELKKYYDLLGKYELNGYRTLVNKEGEKLYYELGEFPEFYINGDIRISQFLSLDDICNRFNRIQEEDDEYSYGDYYGVMKKGEEFLEEIGFEPLGNYVNTYNYESILHRVYQYIFGEINGQKYILLQAHNGGDVRGNRSKAKLFKVDNDILGINMFYPNYVLIIKSEGGLVKEYILYSDSRIVDYETVEEVPEEEQSNFDEVIDFREED